MSISNSTDSIDNLTIEKREDLETRYDGTAFPALVTRVKALFIDTLIILTVFIATTLFISSFGDIPNFMK